MHRIMQRVADTMAEGVCAQITHAQTLMGTVGAGDELADVDDEDEADETMLLDVLRKVTSHLPTLFYVIMCFACVACVPLLWYVFGRQNCPFHERRRNTDTVRQLNTHEDGAAEVPAALLQQFRSEAASALTLWTPWWELVGSLFDRVLRPLCCCRL
jgi:hypothetical protein